MCFVLGAALAAQPVDVDVAVAGIGSYVEQYYARAQRLILEETVVMQPLTRSWSFDGFARRLEYEVRVEWNPSATNEPATVVRELVRASGPPLGPPDQPDCLDPRALSPEPLAFLLPDRHGTLDIRLAGTSRMDDRDTLMLDYRIVSGETPTAEWTGHCAWVDLSGRTRGRVWADATTFEILRVDEHLVGPVDIDGPRDSRGPRRFTFERADTTIRYKHVRFENPDAVLVVPARIERMTVVRNSAIPRMRVTQTYDNYRRFVTESRIVP